MRVKNISKSSFSNNMIEEKQFEYNTDLVSREAFNEHLLLYKGYVNKSNEIIEKLKSDRNIDEFYGLKELETYSNNGCLLHELFFGNLKKYDDKIPQNVLNMFDKYFEGVEQWKEDFRNCSKISRGWCLTVYDVLTDGFKNIILESHNKGLISGCIPLICFDLYEHSLWFDYQTRKLEYINKFIEENIAWDVISDRLSKII